MIKRFTFELFVVFVVIFFCQPLWGAKEDTAQISLKKTAVSKKKFHLYTIKEGDVISAIIRKLPGITEDDIPDNYRIIKQLNPDVPNFNKLYTGQVIKLPGKSGETAGEVSTAKAAPSGAYTYKIKKGDSLITIINHELNIKTDIRQTIRLIKSLNPRITNINRIFAGRTIFLPGKNINTQQGPDSTKTIQQMEESQPQAIQAENKIEKKETKVMPREAKLAAIKYILTQMKATFMTSGNYYLPISKSGQITIDCRKIPVIEFDSKNIVFLDLENRLNDSLRKMIRDSWKTYSIVRVNKKDDIIVILRKIFTSTKAYSMSKRDLPLTTGTRPPLEVTVDWLISKADSMQSRSLMQGLRFVQGNNSLLPQAIKNYARQNGLIVTEIDKETGLVGKPEEIYSMQPMPVFTAASAKDFTYKLVTHLGLTAKKDADIKVFDVAKDGYNLSIKVDILINKANKKYIIHSQNLSPQFINIFKREHYELISIADSDKPNILIEKVLPALAIPSTSGYFTFSGTDKNQAPYTFGFTGIKIKAGKDLYVIDFAINDGLRGLISELWSADIARY
ncbi:MAG: LysM peptidoglycan-binding domain-containing protein [Smithella sp.]